MSYNQFTDPGNAKLTGKKVQYFAELLETKEAESLADYEHKYWNAYSGLTRNVCQKGKAYYIGCFTEKSILKDIYRRAAKDAGISVTEAEFPIIIRSGENELGSMIHYVLHYSDEKGELICPFEKVKDVLTEEVYEKGDRISLTEWDVKVFEEK